MDDVIQEALAEAGGRSSKRWALLLIAFIAGAVVAVRLGMRLREQRAAAAADDLPVT